MEVKIDNKDYVGVVVMNPSDSLDADEYKKIFSDVKLHHRAYHWLHLLLERKNVIKESVTRFYVAYTVKSWKTG